jgi:hypothetical protein
MSTESDMDNTGGQAQSSNRTFCGMAKVVQSKPLSVLYTKYKRNRIMQRSRHKERKVYFLTLNNYPFVVSVSSVLLGLTIFHCLI